MISAIFSKRAGTGAARVLKAIAGVLASRWAGVVRTSPVSSALYSEIGQAIEKRTDEVRS